LCGVFLLIKLHVEWSGYSWFLERHGILLLYQIILILIIIFEIILGLFLLIVVSNLHLIDLFEFSRDRSTHAIVIFQVFLKLRTSFGE